MKSKWFIVRVLTYVYNVPRSNIEEFVCGLVVKGNYGKIISLNYDDECALVELYESSINDIRECVIRRKDIEIMSKDELMAEMI